MAPRVMGCCHRFSVFYLSVCPRRYAVILVSARILVVRVVAFVHKTFSNLLGVLDVRVPERAVQVCLFLSPFDRVGLALGFDLDRDAHNGVDVNTIALLVAHCVFPQGTRRCNGRFLFLENDESRKPFVAAGAPNRVVCIGVNLSRAPSRHLPQVLLRSQYEHMDTRRNGECRLGYVSTSLSPGSLHSSTG